MRVALGGSERRRGLVGSLIVYEGAVMRGGGAQWAQETESAIAARERKTRGLGAAVGAVGALGAT